jgi:hypothetical protein
MNEKLKELAKQAGWTGLYTTYNEPTGEANWEMVKESITVPVTQEQIERFAELVEEEERKECAKQYLEITKDVVKKAILREREACAKECENQTKIFLSNRYAVGQPLSSYRERFAAEQCATAIRERTEPKSDFKTQMDDNWSGLI